MDYYKFNSKMFSRNGLNSRCSACILIGLGPTSGELSPHANLISTSRLMSSFFVSTDTRGHPDKLHK